MGLIGIVAFAANLSVAALLYAYRDGDSNMRSVWLCTRNDALGNLAVILAAIGVFGTGASWRLLHCTLHGPLLNMRGLNWLMARYILRFSFLNR